MNAVSKVNPGEHKLEVVKEAPPLAPPPAGSSVPEVIAPAQRRRVSRRVVWMAALPVLIALGGGYVWVTGGRYQETDNANVRQAKVSIATEATGRIVKVAVADNALVKAGDLLFAVDPQPYQIALSQADASLATARLNVEQLGPLIARRSRRSASLPASSTTPRPRTSAPPNSPPRASTPRPISTKPVATSTRPTRSAPPPRRASPARAPRWVATPTSRPTGIPWCCWRKPPATRLPTTWSRPRVRAPADGIVSQASSLKVGQFVTAGTPVCLAGRDGRHLGRGELQGDAAHPHAPGPKGRDRRSTPIPATRSRPP